MYAYFFNALEQAGVVDAHRAVGHPLLLALDGTAYCSSPTLHCEHGSTHHHAHGQVTYVHAAVTPVRVKPGRSKVIAAGRSRWKIENENNNVLKTKGDHFEHHYGHGQQHLSSLLASLIILAFLTHTVLEWLDDRYRLLRQKLPSRPRLFNDIRTLTTYRCFDSWAALTAFMLNSFDQPPPPPNTG